jgi:hypothetical protein
VQRELEIRSAGTVAALHPVQGGLFDRRSQAEAVARDRTRTAWQAQADVRLSDLDREAHPRIRTDVVAICSGGLDAR